MKTDTYSKIVLTVIAVCLVILTLQQTNLIPKAYASEAKASAFSDADFRFDYAGNLKVSIQNTPDVKVDNSYIYVREY